VNELAHTVCSPVEDLLRAAALSAAATTTTPRLLGRQRRHRLPLLSLSTAVDVVDVRHHALALPSVFCVRSVVVVVVVVGVVVARVE